MNDANAPSTKWYLRPGAGLLAATALVALAYVAIVWTWPHAFWSPDCDLKYAQIRSIRWDGGLHWDIPYAGRALDPRLEHVPIGISFFDVRAGHVFLVWPLPFFFVSRLFEAVLGFGGLFVLPVVSGIAIAYLTGRTADLLQPGTGPFATLVAGLTTPLLIYSTQLWEHAPAAVGPALAMWAIASERVRPSRGRLVVAGLALGIAAGSMRADVYTFIAALLVAIALAGGPRRIAVLVWLGLGIGAASAPLWATNLMVTGHLIPLNAAKNFSTPSLAYFRSADAHLLGDFLVGEQTRASLARAFVVTAVAVALVGAASRWLPRRWGLAARLAALTALAYHGALIAHATATDRVQVVFHGFLAVAPFVVVGLLPYRAASSPPSQTRSGVLWTTALLYTAFYYLAISLTSSIGANTGGVEWGPRFFLPAFPLLVALGAVHTARMASDLGLAGRVALVAVIGLLIVDGAWMARTGVRVIRREMTERRDLAGELRASAPLPMVVDVWWMAPMDLDGFGTRRAFLFDPQDAPAFRSWAGRVVASGADEVELVSFIGPSAHPFLKDDPRLSGRPQVEEAHRGPGGAWFMRLRVTAAAR